MFQDLLNALGAERYMAHSLCLTSDPTIMVLYIMSDGATWLAYMVIGIALLIDRNALDVSKHRPSTRVLFGAFIFLCGLSHFTMILTLFSGVYRLDVMVRALMGAVSSVTAFVVAKDLIEARR